MILVVLSLKTLELWKVNAINTVPPTQLHRLARLAGRVIENALGSGTTDVLMKFSPGFRANESVTKRNGNGSEVFDHSTNS